MEMPTTCLVHNELTSSGCCKNKLSYYSVDENYNTSSFQISEVVKKPVHIIASAFVNPQYSLLLVPHIFTNISPPELVISNAVNLQDICVFRI